MVPRWAGSCCLRAPATLVFGCPNCFWRAAKEKAHINGGEGGGVTHRLRDPTFSRPSTRSGMQQTLPSRRPTPLDASAAGRAVPRRG